MTKKQRVQYALAVIDGQRPFPKHTKAVVARACGVSPSSVYREQKGGSKRRRSLAAQIARTSAEQLAATGRQLGPEWVWEKLIAPAIAE